MADLVAQGPEQEQRWRHTLPARPVTLGRIEKCDWEVSWDERISRLHATLAWQDGKLHVRKDPRARNDIFYQGQKARSASASISLSAAPNSSSKRAIPRRPAT
jgi:adenylate cyclase